MNNMRIKHSYYATPMRSDELMHWKYKDKYMGPSGKYVYVYDDGSASDFHKETSETSTTDSYGNTVVNRKQTITNPNRWTTKKSSDTEVEMKSNGLFKKTSVREINTETVEYGKLHMLKTDLQRHVSDIPKRVAGLPHAIASSRKKSKEKALNELRSSNSKQLKKMGYSDKQIGNIRSGKSPNSGMAKEAFQAGKKAIKGAVRKTGRAIQDYNKQQKIKRRNEFTSRTIKQQRRRRGSQM